MKTIAINYINHGLSVLPADKSKKRPIGAWKEFQSRIMTHEEAATRLWPGICIVTGAVSGNLLLIDFDQKGLLFDAFMDKVPEHVKNKFVIETSQNGGKHIIFRVEDGPIPLTKLANDANGKTLIETRGEGGLFLCYPTDGYTLDQGDLTDIKTLSVNDMEKLLDLAKSFDVKKSEPKVKTKKTFTPSSNFADDDNRPGSDFNRRGRDSTKSMLKKLGWTYVFSDATNEYWRRPGKEDGQSASLHLTSPFFRVFTSSVPELDANQTYTFFDLYTIYEHGGSYKNAANELASQGYGKDISKHIDLPEFIFTAPTQDEKEREKSREFPEHLLDVPGDVGRLADFINETSFVKQPVLALAASISFYATMSAQLVKDCYGTRPNMYLIGLAPSGSGKDRARKVIKEIFDRLAENPAVSSRQPARSLIEDTASYQAIVKQMSANNGVILWLWDEIGKVLPIINKDFGTSLAGIPTLLMRLYTSSDSTYIPNVYASKDNVASIKYPHLTIYGTSTAKNVLENITADNLVDGFMSRLLIFEGRAVERERVDLIRLPPVPDDIMESAIWWIKRRNSAITGVPEAKELMPSIEAEDQFWSLLEVPKHYQADKDIMEALWSRSIEQARKFSLIYAVSNNRFNPIIDQKAAQWGTELAAYLTNRKVDLAGLHVYSNPFERQQNDIIRFLKDSGGSATMREIGRKFRGISQKIRQEIIENLAEIEYVLIEKIERKEGGRSSFLVTLIKDN